MKTNMLSLRQSFKGFVLIELMLVIVIICIITGFALPVYDRFSRQGMLAEAQQEMLRLGDQLERHKAKNFSYKGFDASYLYKNESGGVISEFNAEKQTLNFPINKTKKFQISIVDQKNTALLLKDSEALGRGWAMIAVSEDPRNFNLVLTSRGLKCKSKSSVSYVGCTNGVDW